MHFIMLRSETRSLLKRSYFRYLYDQMRTLKGISTEEESHKHILPTFRLALNWPDHVAISDEYGHYTYRGIFNSSKQIADLLTHNFVGKTQERVSFLCPNDASYVITQWACWMSGQIAVPLSHSHPEEMLEYFIKDSDSGLLLTTNEYIDRLEPISKKAGKKLLVIEDDVRRNAMVSPNSHVDFNTNIEAGSQKLKGGLNPNLYSKLNAMIIYTSGSTGPPKGVLISFANLHSQVNSLIKAWKWKDSDSILHALPLHHVHGVINALMCPLHVGARCVMLRKFDACKVWSNLLSMEYGNRRVNVFMGVPTMYVKLIDEYKNSLCKTEILINYVKHTCSQKVRLMVSGSAALSEPIACEWERITGHRLLERYGMTEIGMALSNPLDKQRKLGFVGTPLPGVSVRIVDGDNVLVEGNERGTKVLMQNQGMKENINTGQLQVKGKNVFKEYWNNPSATAKEFTTDGWFKTGDTVQYIEDSYRILGRTSVDIIKTGGYKVSALFIETILLQYPRIKDVSVVGVPDSTWGQKVAAVVVSKDDKDISVTELRVWASNKLPHYSIPTVVKMSGVIERNLMGKVNKKLLLSEYFQVYNRK